MKDNKIYRIVKETNYIEIIKQKKFICKFKEIRSNNYHNFKVVMRVNDISRDLQYLEYMKIPVISVSRIMGTANTSVVCCLNL